jgi:AcrR family transcriptional regulator
VTVTLPSETKPKTLKPRELQREETRLKIIDAALECLYKFGYSATTTAAVAKLAGISQGALFNHYQTKEQLLGAVARETFPRVIEKGTIMLNLNSGESPTIASLIDLLWMASELPEAQAMHEIYLACRTNKELRKTCADAEKNYRHEIKSLAKATFPHLAEMPNFNAYVEMALATIRGASLGRCVTGPSNNDVQARLALIKALEVAASIMLLSAKNKKPSETN